MNGKNEKMPRSVRNPTASRRGAGLAAPLLLGFGWLCVALGLVGVFLPVLPTTPFLLLALWAFARSSPRLRAWLWGHRILGPYIHDWVSHHVIPTRAKILAVLMMTASLAWMFIFRPVPVWVAGTLAVVMTGVACFVVTRPGRPPERPKA